MNGRKLLLLTIGVVAAFGIGALATQPESPVIRFCMFTSIVPLAFLWRCVVKRFGEAKAEAGPQA